jgi:hypothetical protein
MRINCDRTERGRPLQAAHVAKAITSYGDELRQLLDRLLANDGRPDAEAGKLANSFAFGCEFKRGFGSPRR